MSMDNKEIIKWIDSFWNINHGRTYEDVLLAYQRKLNRLKNKLEGME